MFRHEFWDKLHLDLPPFRQALLLYDAAVNCGCKQAVKFSQRGFNACPTRLAPLVVDGLMGPKTLAALEKDTDCLTRKILDARRDFYRTLAANKPSQKVFLKGWLNRVNDLENLIFDSVRT